MSLDKDGNEPKVNYTKKAIAYAKCHPEATLMLISMMGIGFLTFINFLNISISNGDNIIL